MTRKLALATAIAVIALTSPVGIGTTEAHGFGGGVATAGVSTAALGASAEA